MNTNLNPEKVVKDLRYDFHTFSIDRFITHVGEIKKREIISIPWTMPPTLFGAWMSDDEEPKEYIFYRDNVPLIHQVHIQLHELSHFLLGHVTLHINRKKIANVLKKNTPLPFTELPRLRSSDKSELEVQAETLAALIQKQVIKHSNLDQLASDLSSETKLANFLKTMGLS
ncbi:MAG: hypothetical protein JNM55_20890 [Anaerolineales bacterium]|nr:hypothetical protein [Anaerolineales bacterium]